MNRYRTCQELGIAPKTESYMGDDPLGYVVSLNVRRRHMDVSQRAMLATEMEAELAEDARKIRLGNLKNNPNVTNRSTDRIGRTPESETSRGRAAKLFGVSGPSVQRAKRVKQQAPERVADIIAGKTTVSAVDVGLVRRRVAQAKRKFVYSNCRTNGIQRE